MIKTTFTAKQYGKKNNLIHLPVLPEKAELTER